MGEPLRVLLVGETAPVGSIEPMLAGAGFVVQRCREAAAALHLARKGGFDAVVVPEDLPPDGGPAFCRLLRESWMLLSVPLVLVLERDGERARPLAVDARADDFLAPPFDVREVASRIALAHARVARSVMLNPLTGLPGNQEINQRLEQRIAKRLPFAACYIDLDNFKAFNDHYGFEQGDQVIGFLARLLTEVVQEIGAPEDFIGHIGGDDFLVLTEPPRVSALSARTLSRFEAGIGSFYRKEDLQRGYILTWDRSGNIQETPILSLSIAVATNSHREIRHIGEVGAILADLKQYVKMLPGSNCVVDRRSDSLGGGVPEGKALRDEAWRQLVLTGGRTARALDTPVPEVTGILEKLGALVRQTGRVGTVCLNVTALAGSGETPVWTEIPAVVTTASRLLQAQRGRIYRVDDLVATSPTHESAMFLFLAPPRATGTGRLEELERVGDRVRAALVAELVTTLGRFESQRFQIHGGASLVRDKGGPLARLVFQGMDAALRAAMRRGRRDRGQSAGLLRRLLETGQIRTVLQPIHALGGGQVLGYEALSRGPRGSDIESPGRLFLVARSVDLMWTLERLCHRLAVTHAAAFPGDSRLFLNCEPELAHDPEFRRLSAADHAALAGRPVVLEISEAALARRLGLVRSAVATFRAQGFEIAVDHLSTDYRVLARLADLRPDFLKFDVALVRGVDRDATRRDLLAAMVRYAREIGARTVAAGVETEEEKRALLALGVEYGQGNLFSPGIEAE
jgi:EAL domain-containing protein (putative c-di-GMP-specific phosphodiesterase class I)/GGDEF domain-containing protein